MSESEMPVARKDGLVIQELPDEVLIYDLNTNKAHCLNETAAEVWKACDGKKTVAKIGDTLSKLNGTVVGEDIIWLAIEQLNEKSLLEKAVQVNFKGQTRREVIKKVGLAAVVALPIITSLVAPTIASAGSTCNQTCTCTLAAACATAGGCACSGSGTSANSCVSPCLGGCGGCNVNNGSSSCTGVCLP